MYYWLQPEIELSYLYIIVYFTKCSIIQIQIFVMIKYVSILNIKDLGRYSRQ